MKITKLEVIAYQRENHNIPWNLLKVHTDEGVTGLGEPVLEGRARTVLTAVDELGDYIIGKDPLEVRRLWQDMFHGSFYRSGNILASAVSGVEQALWDVSGKWYGVPAYDLMGGKVRDRIRMYAHARPSPGNDTPEGWADAAMARKNEGFNAVKVMVVGYDRETKDRTPVRRFENPKRVSDMADRIGAVRGAAGNDFDIAVELHGMYSPSLAKEFI
jgi:galactonate dehydratase